MTRRLLLLTAAFLLSSLPVLAQPVNQPFTFHLVPSSLPHVLHGAQSWGDIDSDGDLDVLITGKSGSTVIARIYRNDGVATDGSGSLSFTEIPATDLEPVLYSASAWGDADGDGDLDAVVIGSRTEDFPYDPRTFIYVNNGASFSALEITSLPALHSGSAAWADFDGDGDQDILLTGVDADEGYVTQIAVNDGDGNFEADDLDMIAVGFGDGRFGDFDADGDPDILLSGASDEGIITRVYRNDDGSFTELSSTFDSVVFSTGEWADYDGDGDLDILLSGGQISPFILEGTTRVYENTGGSFIARDLDLDGALAGDATWGDYDNDGDYDIFVLGALSALGGRTARIYENEDGDFRSRSFLVGTFFGDAEWGDFDADGDLDLLTSGLTSSGQAVTNLYRNERQVEPDPPLDPLLAPATVDSGRVLLAWSAGAATTPELSMTYNVRVGTTSRASDVLSPLSDHETGRRLVSAPGNVFGSTSLRLSNLDSGTYYWSVQAVNQAFVPSPFSPEQSFVVTSGTGTDTEPLHELPRRFSVSPSYPNPFSDQSTIELTLPVSEQVRVRVFSVLGTLVSTLVSQSLEPGTHRIVWNGRSSSGIAAGNGLYFYEVRAGSWVRTGTMTLVR